MTRDTKHSRKSKKKIELPDVKFGQFEFPGVGVAKRTRHCHMCGHKIYPKESHFFRLHPFKRTFRAKLATTEEVADMTYKGWARENICILCGKEYFEAICDSLQYRLKQFRKLYRQVDKYIDQSDITFRRVLEDKL